MPAVLAALWAGAGATATNLTRAGRGGAAAGSWRCRHRHERGDEGTQLRRGWWRASSLPSARRWRQAVAVAALTAAVAAADDPTTRGQWRRRR